MSMRYGEQKWSEVYGERIMVQIKKRDGRKEPFIPEKIIVSAIKSGSPPDYARTIAQDIERNTKDGATTQEIKVKVLSMLKSKNPEWERNWKVYDTAVKKRGS